MSYFVCMGINRGLGWESPIPVWLLAAIWETRSPRKMDWARAPAEAQPKTSYASIYRRIARNLTVTDPVSLLPHKTTFPQPAHVRWRYVEKRRSKGVDSKGFWAIYTYEVLHRKAIPFGFGAISGKQGFWPWDIEVGLEYYQQSGLLFDKLPPSEEWVRRLEQNRIEFAIVLKEPNPQAPFGLVISGPYQTEEQGTFYLASTRVLEPKNRFAIAYKLGVEFFDEIEKATHWMPLELSQGHSWRDMELMVGLSALAWREFQFKPIPKILGKSD